MKKEFCLLLNLAECYLLYGNIQKETDTERIFTIIFRGFVIPVKSLTVNLWLGHCSFSQVLIMMNCTIGGVWPGKNHKYFKKRK